MEWRRRCGGSFDENPVLAVAVVLATVRAASEGAIFTLIQLGRRTKSPSDRFLARYTSSRQHVPSLYVSEWPFLLRQDFSSEGNEWANLGHGEKMGRKVDGGWRMERKREKVVAIGRRKEKCIGNRGRRRRRRRLPPNNKDALFARTRAPFPRRPLAARAARSSPPSSTSSTAMTARRTDGRTTAAAAKSRPRDET